MSASDRCCNICAQSSRVMLKDSHLSSASISVTGGHASSAICSVSFCSSTGSAEFHEALHCAPPLHSCRYDGCVRHIYCGIGEASPVQLVLPTARVCSSASSSTALALIGLSTLWLSPPAAAGVVAAVTLGDCATSVSCLSMCIYDASYVCVVQTAGSIS
jgi:hypothetical protein